jgi:UDP-N-acetylmuramate--alanine ligase
MLEEGKAVSGSDMSENEITSELSKLGVNINVGQNISLVPPDVDLIVYTIAVKKYDPKFFEELRNNFKVPILSYPEMLGLVTYGRYTIAVSGTHGKTTTTAMVAKILMDSKHDPSVIVGSLLKDSKSNLIIGKSNFFVVEACEYERSFLNIKPRILIITNIEKEHLDYYKDLSDIQDAFKKLMLQTEDLIIYNGKDPNVVKIITDYESRNKKAGVADYTQYLEKIPKLSVPGIHNRMNAAAAFAVADMLNINELDAMNSLAQFSGTWRRLDKKGQTPAGTIIYDDYAHHPTEILASLQGLRELFPKHGDSKKKITVLFQPHLYSRTKNLFDDFSKSFKDADKVMILPIYFAREQKDESVSSEKLAEAIVSQGGNAVAFPDFSSAEQAILALNLGPEDVFVTMGAGEASKVIGKVFSLT